MRDKLRFATVAGIFLLGFVLSALAHAQVIGIPKSNRVIFGRLTLPDKSTASFVVRDGTLLTIEDRRSNYFFGFNGIINDATGSPNFVAYQLIRTTPDETRIEELDKSRAPEATSPDAAVASRDIRIGKAVIFASAKGIKLNVTGVGEWTFAAPYVTVTDVSQYSVKELNLVFGVSGDGMCCVTCQARTLCASAIDTSCGSCGGSGGGFMEN